MRIFRTGFIGERRERRARKEGRVVCEQKRAKKLGGKHGLCGKSSDKVVIAEHSDPPASHMSKRGIY